MFRAYASNYTQSDLASTLTVAANAQSIYVYAILLTNTGINNNSAGITVTIADTTSAADTIIRIRFALKEFVNLDIPFIADKGLQLSASSAGNDLEVTVFHSNVGA